MNRNDWVVNRCVCHKCTFLQIQTFMKEYHLQSLSDVVTAGICGTKCQMCHMYIQHMIETGETEFSYAELNSRRNA